jgi:hypothetical protein
MNRSKWIAALGCLGVGLGAVIAAQGCTVTTCTGNTCGGSIVSDQDGAPPIGSDDAGNPQAVETGSTAPDPCNSCLYGQCVSDYSNCVANASCLSIYQCATSPACAADGGNCVGDCYQAGTSVGQALYLALGNCDQAAECSNISAGAPCAALCNVSPCPVSVADAGGTADAGGEDSAVPNDDAGTSGGNDAAAVTCSACTAASCSQQVAACAVGTECATYNQCLGGCATLECDTACASAYPNGATTAQALGTCTANKCPQCFN